MITSSTHQVNEPGLPLYVAFDARRNHAQLEQPVEAVGGDVVAPGVAEVELGACGCSRTRVLYSSMV